MRRTARASIDDFTITYTQDGENYRYCITDTATGDIHNVGTGSGDETTVRPSITNLQRTLKTWMRMAKPTRTD